MIKVTVSTKWDGPEVKVRGKKAVNMSAFEIGLIVQGQAKELAPVGQYAEGTGRVGGRLRGSITTQSNQKGTAVKSPATSSDEISKPQADGEVYVGTAVEYAPYVEFGTRYMDAQPFLRPALDLAQGKVLTIVTKNGKAYLREYIK